MTNYIWSQVFGVMWVLGQATTLSRYAGMLALAPLVDASIDDVQNKLGWQSKQQVDAMTIL